jgi:hypothetical protein
MFCNIEVLTKVISAPFRNLMPCSEVEVNEAATHDFSGDSIVHILWSSSEFEFSVVNLETFHSN